MYRVKNWNDLYETSETRKLVRLSWVPVRNKHDGEGYRRMMDEKDGITLYGCWHLILQVASKCAIRGDLSRDDGTPLDAIAISLKTGWRHPEQIQRTLDFCSSPEIDWLQCDTTNLPTSQEIPLVSQEIPLDEWNGIEGNRREEKKKSKPPVGVIIPPSLLAIDGFQKEWDAWMEARKAKRCKATPRAQELLLAKLAQRPANAVAAVRMAIERNWTGFEWDWAIKPTVHDLRRPPATPARPDPDNQYDSTLIDIVERLDKTIDTDIGRALSAFRDKYRSYPKNRRTGQDVVSEAYEIYKGRKENFGIGAICH